MKIKDFATFLAGLDQEADILVADYYYDCLEGYSDGGLVFSDHIKRPDETRYYKHYGEKGNVYLMDFWGTVL